MYFFSFSRWELSDLSCLLGHRGLLLLLLHRKGESPRAWGSFGVFALGSFWDFRVVMKQWEEEEPEALDGCPRKVRQITVVWE